jgi:hypothetical protein
MYYQNPNPTDVRSSSHARMLFFLQLSFSLCTLSCMRVCCVTFQLLLLFLHAFFPTIILLSTSAWCQQPCRQRRTHNPTPSDGSAMQETSTSTNNVAFITASIPSKMRYCVMFPLSKFVILFWDNHIYGNVMLYMSLGLTILLLL